MLAQGVLLGIASALLFHPSLAVIPQWFSTKRALAIGIAVAGSALGGAIFPIILSNLFNVIGFGWTIRVVGFISLAFLAIANVLVKARLPPRGASSLDGLFVAFKNKTYALLVAGCFVLYLSLFVPYFYISTYAEAAGLDVSLAFYCLTFTNAAGVVGRLAINHAADIFGRFNVLLISTSLTATFTLALWLTCSNTAAVIAYSILFGLWGGATISLIPACCAEVSLPHQIGTRSGLLYFFCSFGALAGAPIGGALITSASGPRAYAHTIIFTGITWIAGSITIFFCKLTRNKNPWAKV